MSTVMARHRCSTWLLTFLISLPFSLHAGAPAWQAELEKIQVQSKSQPHEANILIDGWLRQISPTELELREQLINTKAYNLIILSEHNNVGHPIWSGHPIWTPIRGNLDSPIWTPIQTLTLRAQFGHPSKP